MPNFHYRAVSGAGDMVEGDMEAASRSMVVERLREQGHFPLNVDEAGGLKGLLNRDLFGSGRISQRDLAIATRELATLLQAGLPLDRALHVLVDVAEERAVADLFGRILESVQGGKPLADSIEAEGAVFPSFYAGMVRAGESGGALHEVLDRLAELMERMRNLRETVRSALIYPAILLVMAVLTIVVLFVFVLPKFRPLFVDMGDDLPVLTQAFLATGDAVEAWWWAGLAVILLAVILFRQRLRNPAFRLRWDGVKLSLPLLGDLLRKVETARFAHTMAMLLRGGQPLLEALGVMRHVITNRSLRTAVSDVTGHLRQGQGLAGPLAESGAFPPLAIHLIRVGEEGGKLEEMLEALATTYDQEVRTATQRMLSVLVPLLTICLGGVIALIIMSVLGAFISVNEIVY